MVNDTTTLNGALSELGETMAANITTKGVSASASDGLTTLAGKILQISGDTPTPPTPTVLFEDGGVTGNVNTNYTKTNTGVNATVSTTGTNISCSYYGDAYYKANALLSGDFQITYNLVQKTNDSGGFALLDSSNSVQAYIEFVNTSTVDLQGTSKSSYTYSNYSSDSIVKVTRVGSTITLYLDDTLIGSKTMSTGDVYFGWKTHSAGSRNFTFKELKIESLDTPYSPCSEYQTQIENAITYINGSGS